MEKQLYQFNFSGMTEKQYDQIWEEVRNAGHANPSGLLHHVASFQNNNCLIVDVWESADAFDKFGAVLRPIMERMGIRMVKPTISPVHYEYLGMEAHVTH